MLRPLRPQLPADVEARETGQHDVEEDERVAARERPAEPFLARADRGRCIAAKGENIGEPRREHGLVFDDEDRKLRLHALEVYGIRPLKLNPA